MKAGCEIQLFGSGVQALVVRPEPGVGSELHGGQKVRIDVADPHAKEAMLFDEAHDLIVCCGNDRWKKPQVPQDRSARLQVSYDKFANDKRMREDFFSV